MYETLFVHSLCLLKSELLHSDLEEDEYIDESGVIQEGWRQRDQAEKAIFNPAPRKNPQKLGPDEIIDRKTGRVIMKTGRVRPVRREEEEEEDDDEKKMMLLLQKEVLSDDEWIDEWGIVRPGFLHFDIKEDTDPVRIELKENEYIDEYHRVRPRKLNEKLPEKARKFLEEDEYIDKHDIVRVNPQRKQEFITETTKEEWEETVRKGWVMKDKDKEELADVDVEKLKVMYEESFIEEDHDIVRKGWIMKQKEEFKGCYIDTRNRTDTKRTYNTYDI